MQITNHACQSSSLNHLWWNRSARGLICCTVFVCVRLCVYVQGADKWRTVQDWACSYEISLSKTFTINKRFLFLTFSSEESAGPGSNNRQIDIISLSQMDLSPNCCPAPVIRLCNCGDNHCVLGNSSISTFMFWPGHLQDKWSLPHAAIIHLKIIDYADINYGMR